MASIRLEMNLRADPWNVWDAVRDVGAIHTRLAPDFVTDVRMDGDARIVTFANGMTAKELIVDIDDAARRLVWAVVEGRPTHHNGSIQIFPQRRRLPPGLDRRPAAARTGKADRRDDAAGHGCDEEEAGGGRYGPGRMMRQSGGRTRPPVLS